MDNGQWWAGYTVVSKDKVTEAQALGLDTSAWKAEVKVLRRALVLSQGKKVNIYMDSKYTFMVIHAHGAIWKERGLLTSDNKDVKYAEEILQLLEAVELLNQVAITHCPGHQRGSYQTSRETKLLIKQADKQPEGCRA